MVAADTLPPLKTRSVLPDVSVYAPDTVDVVTDVVVPPDEAAELKTISAWPPESATSAKFPEIAVPENVKVATVEPPLMISATVFPPDTTCESVVPELLSA